MVIPLLLGGGTYGPCRLHLGDLVGTIRSLSTSRFLSSSEITENSQRRGEGAQADGPRAVLLGQTHFIFLASVVCWKTFVTREVTAGLRVTS
jgi:hypothetical protein